jgi:hypothetical protein
MSFFGGPQKCVVAHPTGLHEAFGFDFNLPCNPAGSTLPEPASHQRNWLFCRKCGCMFWGGNGAPAPLHAGRCAVDNRPHDGTGSFNFVLPNHVAETAGTQSGWLFCATCSVMFFGGKLTHGGVCVNGKQHDGRGSFNFVLPHNKAFVQPPAGFGDDVDQKPVDD